MWKKLWPFASNCVSCSPLPWARIVWQAFATAGGNPCLAVRRLVQPIVTAETPRIILVTEIVRITRASPPAFGEKVRAINLLDFLHQGSNLWSLGILPVQCRRDLIHGFSFSRKLLDQGSHGIRFNPGQGGVNFAGGHRAIDGVVR